MNIFVCNRGQDYSLTLLNSHTSTVSNCHVCFDGAFDLWLGNQVNDLELHGHLVSFDSIHQNLFRCLVF